MNEGIELSNGQISEKILEVLMRVGIQDQNEILYQVRDCIRKKRLVEISNHEVAIKNINESLGSL